MLFEFFLEHSRELSAVGELSHWHKSLSSPHARMNTQARPLRTVPGMSGQTYSKIRPLWGVGQLSRGLFFGTPCLGSLQVGVATVTASDSFTGGGVPRGQTIRFRTSISRGYVDTNDSYSAVMMVAPNVKEPHHNAGTASQC